MKKKELFLKEVKRIFCENCEKLEWTSRLLYCGYTKKKFKQK